MLNSLRALSLCLVVNLVAIAFASADDETGGKLTAAEVESAIEQLKSEQARLGALEKLIRFASIRIFQVGSVFVITGNAEQNALIRTAADAVREYRDFNTMSLALKSDSMTLQFWALFHLPRMPTAEVDHWKSLLPRVRDLAGDANSSIRREAQRHLRSQRGEGAFLAKCVETETCLENIMFQLRQSHIADLSQQLNPYVLRLLAHKDEAVRHQALLFVGFNSRRAPMWQVEFTDKVFVRVVELS